MFVALPATARAALAEVRSAIDAILHTAITASAQASHATGMLCNHATAWAIANPHAACSAILYGAFGVFLAVWARHHSRAGHREAALEAQIGAAVHLALAGASMLG